MIVERKIEFTFRDDLPLGLGSLREIGAIYGVEVPAVKFLRVLPEDPPPFVLVRGFPSEVDKFEVHIITGKPVHLEK